MGLTQKLGTIPLAIQTDSSNNVGIGTATPNSYANLRTLTINGTNGSVLDFTTNGTLFGELYSLTNELRIDAVGASSRLGFFTNSIERMRITSGGTIALGNAGNGTGYGIEFNNNATQPRLDFVVNSVYTAQLRGSGTDAFLQNNFNGGNLIFQTNGGSGVSERMRITSGGSVLIGATSVPSGAAEFVTGSLFVNSNLYIGNSNGTTGRAFRFDGFANALYGLWSDASGVDQTGVVLNYGAGSWTSSSDERLKEINGNIENAVDKLKTLRAINYSWKSDETKKENLGLIAQDVKKVFPQVVDTIKDGYLGVRYTELIPVLVKAIQELNAKVTALENK